MLRISKSLILTTLLLVGSSPAWARLAPETISNDESKVLWAIRANAIEQSTNLAREANTWGQCFKSEALCPPAYKSNRNVVRRLIRIKNSEYRKAMAMMNPNLIERGLVKVTLKGLPFFSPSVTLTQNGPESEYEQIVKLMQKDRDAMREKIVRTKGVSTSSVSLFNNIDPKRSRFYKQALTLYELQVRNALYEYPFLSFMDVVDPTDEDISVALTKMSEASSEEIAKLKDIEATPLTEFIHFYANAGVVLETHPEWKPIYENLKSQVTGINAAYTYFNSKLNWFFLGLNMCSITAFYFGAPHAAAVCGLISIPLAASKMTNSYVQYQRDLVQWLMRQKTAEQLGDSQQDFLFRAVALGFMLPSFVNGVSTVAREGLTAAMVNTGKAIRDASFAPLRMSASTARAEVNVLHYDSRAYFIALSLTHRDGGALHVNPAMMQSGFGAAYVAARYALPVTFAQVAEIEKSIVLPR